MLKSLKYFKNIKYDINLRKKNTYILLLFVCGVLLVPRLCFMFADPNDRWAFREEKASGYASRSAELFDSWDCGGGRYQPAAAMPAATIVTRAAFCLFGVGIWQLRLPFVFSSLICLYCFGLVLVRCCGGRLGLLALAAFGSSPLLMLLNSTAITENLYPAYISVVLLLFTELEGRPTPAKTKIVVVLLGLFAFLAMMVKLDGAIIILSVVITLGLGQTLLGSHKRLLMYCIVGGLVAAGIYFWYIISVTGFEPTVDFYRFLNEIWAGRKLWAKNSFFYFQRLYPHIPNYIQAFLPGFLFFGICGVLLLPFRWRKQSLAVQFSLLFLFLYIPMLIFTPQLSMKRFFLILVPFFFVAVMFVHQLAFSVYSSPLARWRFIIIVAVAATVAVHISSSNFKWMRSIVWWLPGSGWTRTIVLIPLLVYGLIRILPRPERLIRAGFVVVSGVLILSGSISFANYHWHTDSEMIGRSIASLVGEENVVADEKAFRYFGYYSNARVLFMHECDLKYPAGVINLARIHNPRFIVACDAFCPIPLLVYEFMHNYELISTFRYSQRNYFNEREIIETICVFRRDDSGGNSFFAPDTTIEAESGFVIGENPKVLSNEPDTFNQYVLNGNIYFKFKIEKKGLYQLKARVISKDNRSGSLFLKIRELKKGLCQIKPRMIAGGVETDSLSEKESQKERKMWPVPHSSKWEWRRAPFKWNLKRGEYRLEITTREPTPIDQIVLKKISNSE